MEIESESVGSSSPREGQVTDAGRDRRDADSVNENGAPSSSAETTATIADAEDYGTKDASQQQDADMGADGEEPPASGPPYVLKLGGLPWQARRHQLMEFLTPVDPADEDVLMTYNAAGDAFVRVHSRETYDKARKLHREHIGKRYIEVTPTTLEEWEQAQQEYANVHDGDQERAILVRGVPYDASEDDLRAFFSEFSVREEEPNALITTRANGRPDGDGYVVFATEEEAARAKEEKDKQELKGRPVELRVAHIGEMYAKKSKADASSSPRLTGEPAAEDAAKAVGFAEGTTEDDVISFFQGFDIRSRGILPIKRADGRLSSDFIVVFVSSAVANEAQQQRCNQEFRGEPIRVAGVSQRELSAASGSGAVLRADGDVKTMVQLSNLAFTIKPRDLREMCQGLRLADPAVWITSYPDGRPTGEAFVALQSEEDAIDAAEQLNGKSFNGRDVGAKQCRRKDLYAALTRPPAAALSRRQRGSRRGGQAQSDHCLRLRGLPFNADIKSVEEFVAQFSPKKIALSESQGRHSGDAYVEFSSVEVCQDALSLNKENLGDRYVETFPCNSEEMKIHTTARRLAAGDLPEPPGGYVPGKGPGSKTARQQLVTAPRGGAGAAGGGAVRSSSGGGGGGRRAGGGGGRRRGGPGLTRGRERRDGPPLHDPRGGKREGPPRRRRDMPPPPADAVEPPYDHGGWAPYGGYAAPPPPYGYPAEAMYEPRGRERHDYREPPRYDPAQYHYDRMARHRSRSRSPGVTSGRSRRRSRSGGRTAAAEDTYRRGGSRRRERSPSPLFSRRRERSRSRRRRSRTPPPRSSRGDRAPPPPQDAPPAYGYPYGTYPGYDYGAYGAYAPPPPPYAYDVGYAPSGAPPTAPPPQSSSRSGGRRRR